MKYFPQHEYGFYGVIGVYHGFTSFFWYVSYDGHFPTLYDPLLNPEIQRAALHQALIVFFPVANPILLLIGFLPIRFLFD